MTTFHYDNARTGSQPNETVLTPSNVNSGSFGKVLSFTTDADVYAQPLYLSQFTMADGTAHNVLFVATEHDTLYAFDADGKNPAQGYLWKKSLLGSGETWLSSADVNSDDLTPDIGITGTPVIDRTGGTIFLVSKSKTSSTFYQRLHAINLADGSEKLNGPTTIAAMVTGTGEGTSTISFNPQRNNQRAALLLAPTPGGSSANSVFIAWGSHGDYQPYHGWIMSYNAADISQQTGVWADTPNGYQGGISMMAGGLSADTSGNIFGVAGNGLFDVSTGGSDYGDTAFRLNATTSGLAIKDWFAPDDQASLNTNDYDFGVSNPVLLPGQTGPVAHLLVTMDKTGQIYLLNRDNLGHYSSSSNADVQDFGSGSASHSNLAFFNNTLFFAGNGGPATAWSFNTSTGKFNTSPQSHSANIFGCTGTDCDGSGANVSLSSNGTQNAILWAIDYNKYGTGPGVLFAYNATNLGSELYDSTQAANGRDTAAGAIKFTTPVVAKGRVYVGGSKAVTVYGLLGAAGGNMTANPVFSPAGGTFSGSQAVTITDPTPGATIYYTTDGSTPTTASTVYTGPVLLSSSGTLSAMAVASAETASGVVSAAYTINASTSSNVISFSAGFSATNLKLNGNAQLSGSRLRITDGGGSEASSAFYTTPVNVQSFTSDFTFQLTNPNADGFAFVIQNAGTSALGSLGGGLGYGPDPGSNSTAVIGKSIAIKFDLYSNNGEGSDSTGLYLNGASPTTPATDLTNTGINLHSTDAFSVHLAYDGTTLTVTITDSATGASATQKYTVNIPATVGANTAYAGFTGGTGGLTATQDILSWTLANSTSSTPPPPPPPSSQPSYSQGFTSSGMTFNGGAVINGTRLRLTDGGGYEARSAFYSTPVNVQSFTTNFTFQLTNPNADGMSFIIQGVGPTALGQYGGGLGYGPDTPGASGGIPSSMAVKFDLYSNSGEGSDSTGLYTNGASPTTPSIDLSSTGINLHSGDVFSVQASYNGTTLTVTITDTVTSASATQNYTVNIPGLVGGNTAYVGFGGGTGGLTATQDILTWTYQAQGTTTTPPPATAKPDYSQGFTTTGLALNGGASVSGTQLQLTDGGGYEARSVFYTTAVGVQNFTTNFTFQLTNANADGFAFVIQGVGPTALGPYGGGLAYGADNPGGTGGIAKSIAVKFDLYSNAGEGSDSTGLYTNGASPTTPAIDLSSTGINLHSGDTFSVQASYNGTTLTVTITDTITQASATQSYTVNIPSLVGATTGYVGFTAGTGGLSATQKILNWSYTGQ